MRLWTKNTQLGTHLCLHGPHRVRQSFCITTWGQSLIYFHKHLWSSATMALLLVASLYLETACFALLFSASKRAFRAVILLETGAAGEALAEGLGAVEVGDVNMLPGGVVSVLLGRVSSPGKLSSSSSSSARDCAC